MKRIAILGASGHGKVVAEIAELNGFDEVVFFDDAWTDNGGNKGGSAEFPWDVIGNTESLLGSHGKYEGCVVAIGHNKTRLEKHTLLKQAGARFVSLIHPAATVSKYTELGEGSVVMANATINPFVKVGEACIVNTGATIDHDCILQDAVHVSPGANLGGGVGLGSYSWVGIGACVKQGIKIGSDVMVGAGAAVVKEVPDHQTVLGLPARPQSDGSCK
jgi:sugar O-acyltransferase (sialic acid O-acetyltransferase NeuD family)